VKNWRKQICFRRHLNSARGYGAFASRQVALFGDSAAEGDEGYDDQNDATVTPRTRFTGVPETGILSFLTA
jgi:hypothetical protein